MATCSAPLTVVTINYDSVNSVGASDTVGISSPKGNGKKGCKLFTLRCINTVKVVHVMSSRS